MTRRIITALAVALGLTACASRTERSTSGPVYSLREVDFRPQRMACSGYDPMFTWAAPGGQRRFIPVEVTFVVDAMGNVDPGSLAFTTNGPGAESAVIRAVRGCTYQPAVRNGERVAVRIKGTFSIPYETWAPEKVPATDSVGRQSPIAPPRVLPGTEGSPR